MTKQQLKQFIQIHRYSQSAAYRYLGICKEWIAKKRAKKINSLAVK